MKQLKEPIASLISSLYIQAALVIWLKITIKIPVVGADLSLRPEETRVDLRLLAVVSGSPLKLQKKKLKILDTLGDGHNSHPENYRIVSVVAKI
jgi:hypothetical protein